MVRLITILLAAALVAGCSSESVTVPAGETPATTTVAFNAAGAPTVEFSVPDMMCEESCAAKVREVLAEQPGVKEVVVDFPNRTATVAIDETAFDAEQAVRLLSDDYGFPNTHLKTADAATAEH
jgi:copper chaperone CopZ